ncbi:hypothetical protein QSV08_06145 [Maribacter sp. BPC-D8]|uniref:hypothetical protein n=1 Tax=Maribacter sp. BPC-D8 TaxID=3053613 RepID=UPI002B468C60|nr:hypothetical protein [Maribacter sp. BPC-D8]WRI30824.1 hypothetical protein QSV08_06145 [Maribacter sp. BPC-D8]
MIDFDKYYSHLGAYELIEIIESNSDYKPEVIAYCKSKIQELNLELDTIKKHASLKYNDLLLHVYYIKIVKQTKKSQALIRLGFSTTRLNTFYSTV